LLELVVAVHQWVLAEHGRAEGIRDEKIPDSVLARPLSKNVYELNSTLFDFALSGQLPYNAHINTHKYQGDYMHTLYNYDAPKKPTNLSVNSDLLKKTKALNINLSAIFEQALRAKLAETAAANWKKENKQAINTYNSFVEENGLFSDEYRNF